MVDAYPPRPTPFIGTLPSFSAENGAEAGAGAGRSPRWLVVLGREADTSVSTMVPRGAAAGSTAAPDNEFRLDASAVGWLPWARAAPGAAAARMQHSMSTRGCHGVDARMLRGSYCLPNHGFPAAPRLRTLELQNLDG